MNPFVSFPDSELFLFHNKDYSIGLVGYPEWRGFISAEGTDIWVEIVPTINLQKKSISVPKRKSEPRSEDPVQQKTRSDNLQKFFATIPADIYSAVVKFPDSHWQLVQAVSLMGRDFLTLLNTNSCLAYIIVNIEKFNPSFTLYSSVFLLQKLIKRKRKEIAGLCGFPETLQIVNILAKIHIDLLDIKTLIKLSRFFIVYPVLSEKIIRRFSFLRSINKNLLIVMTSYPYFFELLQDNILNELLEDESFKSKIEMLQLLYTRSQLWRLPFPKITSLNNLPEQVDKMEAKIKLKLKFPDPPLKGNEFIQPITSEDELISWSKKQRNCIRSYASRIKQGKSFMYKVIFKGEEATLEIITSKKGLKIGELRGFGNASVSSELRGEIKRWWNK